MARAGPKKTRQYGVEFKRTAVQLSHRPGLQVPAVAEALDVPPFMLSRWRKEFREGRLRPATPVKARAPKAKLGREIRRLQALERAHQELQAEHALLKPFIRFTSARRRPSSRSSTKSGRRSGGRASVGPSTSRGRGTTRGATGPSVRTRGRTGCDSRRCV